MYSHSFKTVRSAVLLLGVCTAIGTANVGAGAEGLYVSVDGGVSIIQEISANVGGITGIIGTDVGLRTDVAVGYILHSSDKGSWAVELETGLVYNGLSSVTAVGVGSAPLSGSYYQVPFLANLVWTIKAGEKWDVTLGAGGGGAYSSMTLDSVNGELVDVSGTETTGAVQGIFGLRYKLSDRSEVGVIYKYLATFPSGMNYIGTHSIGVSYTMHF